MRPLLLLLDNLLHGRRWRRGSCKEEEGERRGGKEGEGKEGEEGERKEGEEEGKLLMLQLKPSELLLRLLLLLQ
jgi:hypothetical protein